jgi:hypothetical protein
LFSPYSKFHLDNIRDLLYDLYEQYSKSCLLKRKRLAQSTTKLPSNFSVLKKSNAFLTISDANFTECQYNEDEHGFINVENSGNSKMYDSLWRVSTWGRSKERGQCKEPEVEDEVSLLNLYKRTNISEEEIIMRFFANIKRKPYNKDNFIRDFDEYYFKVRPKLSSKLIRLLLEVINYLRWSLMLT